MEGPSGFWNRESCLNNHTGFLKRVKKTKTFSQGQSDDCSLLELPRTFNKAFPQRLCGKLTSYQIRRGLPTPAALWRQGCSSSVFPGPNKSKAEQVCIPHRHVHELMCLIRACAGWAAEVSTDRQRNTLQTQTVPVALSWFPSMADQDECPLVGSVCVITIISKTCVYTHINVYIPMFKIGKTNKKQHRSLLVAGLGH